MVQMAAGRRSPGHPRRRSKSRRRSRWPSTALWLWSGSAAASASRATRSKPGMGGDGGRWRRAPRSATRESISSRALRPAAFGCGSSRLPPRRKSGGSGCAMVWASKPLPDGRGSELDSQFRLQLRHVVPCEAVAPFVFSAVLQQLQQVHPLRAAFGGGYGFSRALAIQRGKRRVEPLAVMLGEPLLHHLAFSFRRQVGTLRRAWRTLPVAHGGLPTGEVVAQVAQMLAGEFPQQHLTTLQALTRGAFQRQLAAGNAEVSEYAPPSSGVFGFIQPGILGGVLLAIERLGLVERAAERCFVQGRIPRTAEDQFVAFEADELHGIGAAVDEPRSLLSHFVAIGTQKGIPAQAATLLRADSPLLE